MKRVNGFTLIEVMIVVAIVAILAAVAVPSYLNSIQKSRRAEAKEALTRIAALQERYFFTNNSYGTMLQLTGNALFTTENGLYDLIITGCNAAPCTSYVVQANPKGTQLEDTDCNRFTIDHVGRKAATDINDDDSTNDCW